MEVRLFDVKVPLPIDNELILVLAGREVEGSVEGVLGGVGVDPRLLLVVKGEACCVAVAKLPAHGDVLGPAEV